MKRVKKIDNHSQYEFYRYKDNNEPFYALCFFGKSSRSKVLNADFSAGRVSGEGFIYTFSECLITLNSKFKQLSQDLNGKGEFGRMDGIEVLIKNEKQAAFNRGDPHWKEISNVSKDKLLEIEASYDICKEEIKLVTAELKLEKEREEAAKDIREKPLKCGCQGLGKVNKGLGLIDFQKIRVIGDDGAPIIDDPRSPFDGLSVADYRKYVVQDWLSRRVHRYFDIRAKSLAQGKIESEIPSLSHTRAKIPAFPKNCINHKAKKA